MWLEVQLPPRVATERRPRMRFRHCNRSRTHPGTTSNAAQSQRRATHAKCGVDRGGRGKREAVRIDVRLTDQTLSCAARAHVATAARHAACLHLSCAMQVA